MEFDTFVLLRLELNVTHGLCGRCTYRLFPGVARRLAARHARRPLSTAASAFAWLTICSACRRARAADRHWVLPITYLRRRGIHVRRGECAACLLARPASR